MTNHTPEPWLAKDGEIYVEETGHTLARLCGYGTQADADRIEACVNACVGFEDPERDIERLKSRAFENDLTTIEACGSNQKLRAEVEALRAALADCLEWAGGSGMGEHQTFENARAALSGKE